MSPENRARVMVETGAADVPKLYELRAASPSWSWCPGEISVNEVESERLKEVGFKTALRYDGHGDVFDPSKVFLSWSFGGHDRPRFTDEQVIVLQAVMSSLEAAVKAGRSLCRPWTPTSASGSQLRVWPREVPEFVIGRPTVGRTELRANRP
jgi:hypothetical protein